jgi:hypothetical protein
MPDGNSMLVSPFTSPELSKIVRSSGHLPSQLGSFVVRGRGSLFLRQVGIGCSLFVIELCLGRRFEVVIPSTRHTVAVGTVP